MHQGYKMDNSIWHAQNMYTGAFPISKIELGLRYYAVKKVCKINNILHGGMFQRYRMTGPHME